MPGIRFDHIAIGMERIADAPPVLVGVLGGRPDAAGPGGGFRWACWRYEDGGRIEVIEPAGADGFLHRFLAARGPGVHHVTFKVRSLEAACARAEAHGYRVVGRDEFDPGWMTAYLHPKEALGIVVQLAQASRAGASDEPRPRPLPARPPDPPPAVTVVGLRLRARDRERAERQWAAVLGGAGTDVGGTRVYRWPGSPMRIAVDVDRAADEGPVAIEVASPRALDWPAGGAASLGTVFVREGGTG